MQHQEWYIKRERLLGRIKELEAENAELRKWLGEDADGRDVIGLYVLNKDNTCHLLCTDFDDKNCKHGYQNDVLAFFDVCKSWNIPCSYHAVYVYYANCVMMLQSQCTIKRAQYKINAHLFLLSSESIFGKANVRLSERN